MKSSKIGRLTREGFVPFGSKKAASEWASRHGGGREYTFAKDEASGWWLTRDIPTV